MCACDMMHACTRRYKTAFYSFYLPIAAGMMLGGITDPGAYRVAEKILVEMGQYFQVRWVTQGLDAPLPLPTAGLCACDAFHACAVFSFLFPG